jgi:ABC-type multidrug transport system fused ATPase/permease subunit
MTTSETGALLRRCLHLLAPVRAPLLGLLAASAGLAAVLVPLGLLLFDSFWTRALQGEPPTALEARLFGLDLSAGFGPAERRALLRRVLLLGFAAGAVVVPAVLGLYYWQVWILQRLNQHLRVALVERVQSLSLRFHADRPVGDAIYRTWQDSAMVTQLVEVLLLTPLFAIGRALFAFTVLALLDLRLALLLLLLLPPMLALERLSSRRLRARFRQAREAQSALTSQIQEGIAGLRPVKACGAEARLQARFETASREAFAAAFSARGLFAVLLTAIFLVVGTGLVASAAFAAELTRRATPLEVGALGFAAWTLGLFNWSKARFGDGAGAVRLLFRAWARAQDMIVGLGRVLEILDLEPEVKDAPDAVPFATPRESIRFREVHFRYAADRPALAGVSFEARPGTVTAVVGPTGSGKTTLMALLLRLFEPERGAIEIDGVDLRRFRVASLRAGISVALQENLLFASSVRENVRYAAPGAGDARVREALRVADAEAFVERLPEGLDTLLGERGAGLSTGQRQRLSIARAVCKDAPILILDEPTASLDAETELRVLRGLAEWGRGRFVFLITHRLSTIRRADRILVLDEGRVAGFGSHAELLQGSAAYRTLLEGETQGPPATAQAGGLR